MGKFLLPGDYICESGGCIKGHGTEQHGNRISSNHFGIVRQIDKLITVLPIFSVRYIPEVGDVIVGRVAHIFNKRWRIDANCKGDTTLALGAINLPGLVQRRKSEEDEINMRKYFDINDLVVCEVQKVNKSGSTALHTRNDRYGKLTNGVLICVSPDRLEPMKSRFITKDTVEVIGGCNGWIWISAKNELPETFVTIAKIKLDIEWLRAHDHLINLENIVNENIS